jgi:uncharacterized protein RhaS with RHS repeats
VKGLDYYNAWYYDPAAGVFLSADTVQGNMQGMNPYGYVGGNPETDTDPTGHFYVGHNGENVWPYHNNLQTLVSPAQTWFKNMSHPGC